MTSMLGYCIIVFPKLHYTLWKRNCVPCEKCGKWTLMSLKSKKSGGSEKKITLNSCCFWSMILSVAMCRLGQDVETFWIEVISYHFSSEKFLLTVRENCNFSCVSTLYFLLYTLGKSIIHPIKDVLFYIWGLWWQNLNYIWLTPVLKVQNFNKQQKQDKD